MPATPVIAIFDVGKTNKKLFLFDEQYQIVFERSAKFPETTDEDGDPCDDLDRLRLAVFDALREAFQNPTYAVKAVNFATYGASLVYVDDAGRPLTPLYNYLKPYPPALQEQFYATYGGEAAFSYQTASPVLGSLNSGLQLYRLKYEQPAVFARLQVALHLPQYLSYLLTGRYYSDLTSIGCHTNLWDFGKNAYHAWVTAEGLEQKLAPIVLSDETVPASFPGSNYPVGVGLHDSSAVLIPYLVNFPEPFVLISTGTWCISLNPFNNTPLTPAELQLDCLCYLTYQGQPVKAARLFAGYEHEKQVARIADYFQQDADRYKTMAYDPALAARLLVNQQTLLYQPAAALLKEPLFALRPLEQFSSDTEAYHQLILDLVTQQKASTGLVLPGTPVKRLFVDGGFSKNAIYMSLLAQFFPEQEVFAASVAQATAVGAALAIHEAWNTQTRPTDIIELNYYPYVAAVNR